MSSEEETSRGAPASSAASGSPAEPFEALIARLTEVVGELEGGELPLERALALFEEGVRLSREGASRLERAEAHVEELVGRTLRPIEPSAQPTAQPSVQARGERKIPAEDEDA